MSIKIGIGIYKTIYPLKISPPIPQGLTLTLISGGVKIDWSDMSSATAQTQIWAKNDSGTYSLITTESTGIVTFNNTGFDPVDLRYYKLRTLRDGLYSAFCTEVFIAMLGANLIPLASSSFVTDGTAYWTPGAGSIVCSWDAINKTMIGTASGQFWLAKSGILTAGETYRVMFDAKSSVTTMTWWVFLGGTQLFPSGSVSSSWNTFSVIGIQSTGDLAPYIMATVSVIGVVNFDNIKVQKVLMP